MPRATASGETRSASPERTLELGRRLGAAAIAGTVLALIGPLGAGKTQLAKGVAEGLGVVGVVNSPTFILMNEHAGRLRLHHIDTYRLIAPEDAVEAGLLDERHASGVTVVEWADRLLAWLPPERMEIQLALVAGEPMARIVRWRAFGPHHAGLAGAALDGEIPEDEVAAAS